MKDGKGIKIFANIFFIIFSLMVIVPFILLVSISFTDQNSLMQYGAHIIPKVWSLEAYKIIFQVPGEMLYHMLFTIIIALTVPIVQALVSSMFGYALSHDDFVAKKFFDVYLIYAMLIGGGMIPMYVVVKNIYHLDGIILFYLLGLTSSWSVILYRTFFKGIPKALIESARLDGANEFKILAHVVFPMSKAMYGIQYFTAVIGLWNSWETNLIWLNEDKKLWTIQYYLQKMLTDFEQIKASYVEAGLESSFNIPITTIKYASCVLALIPIFIVFPKISKTFSKGVAIGSVKG